MVIYYKEKTFFTSKDLALSVIGGRWKIAIIGVYSNSLH